MNRTFILICTLFTLNCIQAQKNEKKNILEYDNPAFYSGLDSLFKKRLRIEIKNVFDSINSLKKINTDLVNKNIELDKIKKENSSLTSKVKSSQKLIDKLNQENDSLKSVFLRQDKIELELLQQFNFDLSDDLINQLKEKSKLTNNVLLIQHLAAFEQQSLILKKADNLLKNGFSDVLEIKNQTELIKSKFNDSNISFKRLTDSKINILLLLSKYEENTKTLCNSFRIILNLYKSDEINEKKIQINKVSSVIQFADYPFLIKVCKMFYDDPSINPLLKIKGINCN